MYIVTSKPKRISVYSGLVHMVYLLLNNCLPGDVYETDDCILLARGAKQQRKTRKTHS